MERSATENSRKRKNSSSSSDDDELDLNVGKKHITNLETEQSQKRQKIKDEVSDFKQDNQDISGETINSKQSLPLESIKPLKKEDPSADKHSDQNVGDTLVRTSVESDSKDEHFSRYCYNASPYIPKGRTGYWGSFGEFIRRPCLH